DDLYEYGTVATVKQILKIPGGIVRVLVEGLYRARIVDINLDNEYYEANIETFEELEEDDPKDKNLEAAKRLVEADLSEYEELDTKQIPGILESVIDNSTSSNLVDTSAGYINLSIEDNQK